MTHTLSAAADDRDTGHVDATLADGIERLLTAGIAVTARAIDETPEASELTLIQWRALVITAESDGVRIGELAIQLGGSVPSVSRLVRRIESRGLVSASRAEDDRRATIVALTPAGRRLVDAVVGRRRAVIRRALDTRRGRPPDGAVALLRDVADRLSMPDLR